MGLTNRPLIYISLDYFLNLLYSYSLGTAHFGRRTEKEPDARKDFICLHHIGIKPLKGQQPYT